MSTSDTSFSLSCPTAAGIYMLKQGRLDLENKNEVKVGEMSLKDAISKTKSAVRPSPVEQPFLPSASVVYCCFLN